MANQSMSIISGTMSGISQRVQINSQARQTSKSKQPNTIEVESSVYQTDKIATARKFIQSLFNGEKPKGNLPVLAPTNKNAQEINAINVKLSNGDGRKIGDNLVQTGYQDINGEKTNYFAKREDVEKGIPTLGNERWTIRENRDGSREALVSGDTTAKQAKYKANYDRVTGASAKVKYQSVQIGKNTLHAEHIAAQKYMSSVSKELSELKTRKSALPSNDKSLDSQIANKESQLANAETQVDYALVKLKDFYRDEVFRDKGHNASQQTRAKIITAKPKEETETKPAKATTPDNRTEAPPIEPTEKTLANQKVQKVIEEWEEARGIKLPKDAEVTLKYPDGTKQNVKITEITDKMIEDGAKLHKESIWGGWKNWWNGIIRPEGTHTAGEVVEKWQDATPWANARRFMTGIAAILGLKALYNMIFGESDDQKNKKAYQRLAMTAAGRGA